MQLSDFYYKLSQELIAKYPAEKRSQSRLLCLDRQTGEIQHKLFYELLDLISPDDLLVFNDSKVIPARLFGAKETGGKVEALVERVLDKHQVLAQIRASKPPQIGSVLTLENKAKAKVIDRSEDLFRLEFLEKESAIEILEAIGHIPLPPYIDREDEKLDQERYQTVYAKHKGSVAVPTAGLHFDEAMFEALDQKGVDMAFVTLHVGAGTFQPVRCENIKEHKMHAEVIEVADGVCEKVKTTKKRGGRVIAVGTTSVRCLETAAKDGEIKPYFGETDIFIYPGYKFKCVDAMVTNFHLPESTLLMLVCAFAGRKNILRAYEEAIKEKYRFYSYGDAMFVIGYCGCNSV